MAFIKEKNNAKIKVEIVKEHQADLLVYVTKKKHEAKGKDEIWHFDGQTANTEIKFVKNSSDIKVYYVNAIHKAKWRKPHRLQKRLG